MTKIIDLTGVLDHPRGYIDIGIHGRYQNGHPVINAELAGNCPVHVFVPEQWIKKLSEVVDND